MFLTCIDPFSQKSKVKLPTRTPPPFPRYGYHITKNSYFICHDQNVIRSLFERLRNYKDKKDSYPTECGRFSVSGVRDLTTGYDSNQPDKKAVSHTGVCQHINSVCDELLQPAVLLGMLSCPPEKATF